MANKTTTINFKEYFSEEYEFLMSQHNRSLFICELIREYMNGGEIQNVRSSQVVKPLPVTPTQQEVKEEAKDEVKKRKPKNIGGVI